MPAPNGIKKRSNVRAKENTNTLGKLLSASIALFAASTVLSGVAYAGTVAPGGSAVVGAGDPAETWNVQNDATLDVMAGGKVNETTVFGTLNMNGATASPSGAPSGYVVTVFGGNANITGSSLSGQGGLGISGFIDTVGSAVVTNSDIQGVSQAVLVQHGSTLNMTGGTVKGGTHGFELINGADVIIDGTTITSGGVGIFAYAGSSAGAVGSNVELRNGSITSVGHGVNLRDGSRAVISGSKIETTGANARGVFANGIGTHAEITDTDIITRSNTAPGIELAAGASANATNVNITTSGTTSSGARVSGDGSTLVYKGGNISTTGGTAHGIDAWSGAQVSVDNVNIKTGGSNSAGLRLNYAGTSLVANGGTINTLGANAYGVDVAAGAKAEVNNVDITTAGGGAYAVRVSNVGSEAVINGGNLTASGVNSAGIIARAGGQVVANDVNIIMLGGNGAAVWAGDAGSSVTYNGGSVTTSGVTRAFNIERGSHLDASNVVVSTSAQDSHGVVLSSNSTGSVSNLDITTSGLKAYGVAIQRNSELDVANTKIVTGGQTAYGLTAQTGSKLEATNILATTTGEGSFGIRVLDADTQVDVSSGSYRTGGTGADGINVSTGAVINIAHEDGALNTRITTTGAQAAALRAFDGSTINASGADVRTLGNGSHAVVAAGGSTVNLTGGGFNPNGTGAHGVVASGGSTVTMNSSIFQVFGADSHGVSLANDSIVIAERSFIGSYAPALKTESGNVVYDLRNGTQVVGTYGTVLSAASGSSTTLTADGNVQLSGDMVAEADDAVIDATLSNKSQWYGAAKGVTSASVDGSSYWAMTGSSDVGALSNDGVVDFDAANPYKTLTAGSLAMNGGSFILNTKLNEGGAASETDKIVVTGDATGNGLINIRNNGGTGAFTGTGATDGIQVVEVGGASDAEFKLGSAAVVGIYDYQLKKADGQNWYLQTEGSDVVDPPACTPGVDCPGDGGDDGDGAGNPGPGTGHVVDIVPGYNIALSAAQNHVLTSLDTFHERLGELRAEELQDGYHAWMRGIGKTGSYSPKSITGYNGHGFDMTTAGVQIGADYSKSDVFVAGDKLTIGMFGEYANSSFNVRGRTADGSISSKGLGGYVTWQHKAPTDRKPGTGAYVDAVVKQDWLEFGVNAKSVSGFDLQNGYKGKATTASIETGYGFDLGNNVVLQPQAQLTWSKVKADSFTDSYGIAVHGQEAESLIGRVGVRLEKTFYFGDEEETVEAAPVPAPKAQKQVKGKKGKAAKAVPAVLPDAPKKKKFVKSVTTYADANVKHEFKGKNGLVASNTGIGNDMGGTRYDVGVGVVARVSENVSLFGRGSVEFGGSTNVAGKVSGGLKITW